jgi:RimJ/RimL family protein N-acetyltransferase
MSELSTGSSPENAALPEIGTPRCILRDWRAEDARRVLDIYSRWEVAHWLGTQPQPMETLDEAVHFIERCKELNRQEPIARRWAVERRRDGLLLGTILLVPLPEPAATSGVSPGRFEIAWHLHPDSWGHGYATEAARAGLNWGFGQGLREIFAVVRPDNVASLNVCRRLHMAALGRTPAYYDAVLELFYVTPSELR